MTITLKIDNPDIEKKLPYKKRDPKKYAQKIEYIDSDNEDLSDVKPYEHVVNSGEYVHKLRRQIP